VQQNHAAKPKQVAMNCLSEIIADTLLVETPKRGANHYQECALL
jgi:hypothetical protein